VYVVSKRIEDILKRVLVSNIFKDREKLRPDYVPDELPHREKEVEKLAEKLAPAVKGERPSNIFIYGLTGTGKTAVTRYVLKMIKDMAGRLQLEFKLMDSYVNCKVNNTNYSVLVSLCESLNEYVPFTGLSIPELFRRFMRALERTPSLMFVVLDEVDALVKQSGDDLLYKLTRINPDLKRSQVAIVGITNDLKFTESLDPRVKSTLAEEEMVFTPYTSEELEDILRQRARIAFKDGVLSDEVIPLCATLAAREHGDARRALDLLRVAGEIAEREGSLKVLETHVRRAQVEIERDRVIEVLRTMPLHGKLTLISTYLLEKAKVEPTTGEVYSIYKGLCRKLGIEPLTHRRISDLINELDMIGLATAKVVNRGRYGVTKLIKLSVPEGAIFEGLKEDERLTSFLGDVGRAAR